MSHNCSAVHCHVLYCYILHGSHVLVCAAVSAWQEYKHLARLEGTQASAVLLSESCLQAR